MRTMLGGRRYKTIRETGGEWTNDVAAYEDGDDLCVTARVFDAFEDVEKRGALMARRNSVDSRRGVNV